MAAWVSWVSQTLPGGNELANWVTGRWTWNLKEDPPHKAALAAPCYPTGHGMAQAPDLRVLDPDSLFLWLLFHKTSNITKASL